jgi:hypothetical protein
MKELYSFKVKNREDFTKFLDLFLKDYLEKPASWENKTIPEFLEALSAYSAGIQGYYNNTKQAINVDIPTWAIFADIFLGAKVYE